MLKYYLKNNVQIGSTQGIGYFSKYSFQQWGREKDPVVAYNIQFIKNK